MIFLDEESLLSAAMEQHRAGNLREAEKLYKEILELNPESFNAFYFMGLLSKQAGQPVAAEAYLKNAAQLAENPAIYTLLGDVLARNNKKQEAEQYLLKAIQMNACDANIYEVLGFCYLHWQNNLAVKNLEKAISLGIKTDSIFYTLGIAYYLENNLKKAAESYKKAAAINPSNVDAYNNIGCLYYNRVGDLDQAITYFEKALKVEPEGSQKYYMISYNLGRTYMTSQKNMLKGWEYYENRMHLWPHHKLKIDPSKCPKWDGKASLKNKNILVYTAGGFGDTLFFARYMLLMKEMGANIYCMIQPQLYSLFEDSDYGLNFVNSENELASLQMDYQIPIMSLPYMFQIDIPDIPFRDRFLKADPKKVEFYRKKYFDNDCFKVGIVWQAQESDGLRSLPHASFFSEFSKIPGVKLYSVQKGEVEKQLKELPEEMEVVELGSSFNDFSDTAAALENLDLTITVDTCIVHLAGALNKPCWLLIDKIADWKWFWEIENCPWYESVKVFRCAETLNWKELLDTVLSRLKLHLGKS